MKPSVTVFRSPSAEESLAARRCLRVLRPSTRSPRTLLRYPHSSLAKVHPTALLSRHPLKSTPRETLQKLPRSCLLPRGARFRRTTPTINPPVTTPEKSLRRTTLARGLTPPSKVIMSRVCLARRWVRITTPTQKRQSRCTQVCHLHRTPIPPTCRLMRCTRTEKPHRRISLLKDIRIPQILERSKAGSLFLLKPIPTQRTHREVASLHLILINLSLSRTVPTRRVPDHLQGILSSPSLLRMVPTHIAPDHLQGTLSNLSLLKTAHRVVELPEPPMCQTARLPIPTRPLRTSTPRVHHQTQPGLQFRV